MSTVALPVPPAGVQSGPVAGDVSLFALHRLRAAYLIMAGGLGVFIWPSVIHHTSQFAIARCAGGDAGWSWSDCCAGTSLPTTVVTRVAVRGDMEGDLSLGVCVPGLVRAPGHTGDGRRYQGRFDGCHPASADSMVLRVHSLRAEAWRPLEIKPRDHDCVYMWMPGDKPMHAHMDLNEPNEAA